MTNNLLNIGFENVLALKRVVGVIDPDSASVKRLIQEAKSQGLLVNAASGRKVKAAVLTDTRHIFLSALGASTLRQRWSDAVSPHE